jgi:hypothetical protein
LNFNLDPPIVIKDRQLAALAAHVGTTIRRLTNVQWWEQATVAEAEAVQVQTTINQKAVAIAADTVLVAAQRHRQPWQWQRQW